jgi:hypothetical protein
MEKFWEWIIEKEYGRNIGSFGFKKIYSNDYYGEPVDPTKQMLIGYMLEYIRSLLDKIRCGKGKYNVDEYLKAIDAVDIAWQIPENTHSILCGTIEKLERLYDTKTN